MSSDIKTKEEMINRINDGTAEMVWKAVNAHEGYIEYCVYVYEKTMALYGMNGFDITEYTDDKLNECKKRFGDA
jgi:hypothetical protein